MRIKPHLSSQYIPQENHYHFVRDTRLSGDAFDPPERFPPLRFFGYLLLALCGACVLARVTEYFL